MDIYDVNEDLVKVLTKLGKIMQYSAEFNNLQPNSAKITYIEDLLVRFEQIKKLEMKLSFHNVKNNGRSEALRKEGNNYFGTKNKDYFKALELYNQSICYAETDSENISIGYANRSAVLFEWKRYRECLENIQMAREANYPDRLSQKIDKREKACLENLSASPQDIPVYDFKLVGDAAHPVVPFISDCLDIKSTPELGRFIYTKKPLAPGDLVSIEEPYTWVLLPPMRYIRCANCGKENFLTLIPCKNCTSAMFCSQSCMEEAEKNFHKFECPIIDLLFTLFNKIHLMALRVVLVTLSQFETAEDCMKFCQDEANQNQNSFTINYKNLTKTEHYRAIHGLATNEDKRSTADLFQRGVICAVLKRFILQHSPLKTHLAEENHVNFFTDLLFRHLQTSPTNMHSVALIEQTNETKDDQCFASAAYAFGSMLNHSCAPNTVRIYIGTKAMLFVLRPIKENETLYDNYGYHHSTQSKRDRQQKLETQYHFTCICEACAGCYPLYMSLSTYPAVPEALDANDIFKLMAFNRRFAETNYERYAQFLADYSEYYPCSQISSTEESLKMALNIMADAVPLKAKYSENQKDKNVMGV